MLPPPHQSDPPDPDQAEIDRVAAVWSTGLVGRSDDEAFDAITRLVATAMDTPVALVNLIDQDRQWTLAHHGPGPVHVPRAESFCTHLVDGTDTAMTVPDARHDQRFATNPLVTGPADVRSYAGAVVTDPDGQRLGALCVIDTRPRVFDERDLRLLAQAATQVAELIEVRRARDEAIANRDERGTFLATAQHQLKTPMAVISGWASALERWPDLTDDDRDFGVETIARSIGELRRQVDDLLDEARVDLLGARLRLRPLDLAETVRRTATHNAWTDNVVIDVPDRAVIRAESAALDHIVSHLVDNACKYSPADAPVEVTVTDHADRCRLSVRDAGVGMPDDVDVFAPFVRGAQASSIARGTGLGLHIVATLADRLGATIGVEHGDPGTTITVDFPRC